MRRFLSAVKMIAALPLLVLALSAVLWVDHLRETTLPTPSGRFPVGRMIDAWIDATHQDPLAPPGTPRQLLVWIWYPAAPGQRLQTVEYLPAPWRAAWERHTSALITKFLTRDLSRVHAHALRDADVSPEQNTYPVLILRAGLAAPTTSYTTLAEDLASHGYVVAGFDAPYRTTVVVLPDGTVIQRTAQNNPELLSHEAKTQLATNLVKAWSVDVGFALDRLEQLNASDPSGRFLGRLDLQRVGVFGHSLGGATALQFCRDDPRCKAGVDVDGAPLGSVIKEGRLPPFMFLLSDHSNEPEGKTAQIRANIRAIYERLPSSGRWMVTIRGANHFMFSDDSAMLKAPPIMPIMRAFGVVRLEGSRQLTLAAHYLRAFFDVELKGAPASTLEKQFAENERAQ